MSSPTVSVVIPVYNDPKGVRMTLESVTNQMYPDEEYEIIVVDNGSSDNTRDVVRSYVERYPELVTLLVEDDIQSPGAARNKGIEYAHGDVLAFTDADMTAPDDWLASAVESLEDSGCGYLGCAVAMDAPDGGGTLATLYDELFRFRMESYLREDQFVGSGCLVVRRWVFDAVGLFDPWLISWEDKEFGKRVAASDIKQHFDSSITLRHPTRSTTADQLKKSFSIGRGLAQLSQRYPDRFEARSPLRPEKFLPLRPRRFYTRVRANQSRLEGGRAVSLREMMGLYCLCSLKKLVKNTGALSERLRLRGTR